MKSNERIIANKIAEYWYKELHGRVAPIHAKQLLANYAEQQIKNITIKACYDVDQCFNRSCEVCKIQK